MRSPRSVDRPALVVGLLLLPAVCSAQWEASVPPSPSDSGHNFLMGVAAHSTGDAWAVGYYQVQEGSRTNTYPLATHWDGTDWSLSATPSPGIANWGTECALYAVEVIAPDDVWAGGYKTIQHPGDGVVGTQLFVLHWDGASWSEVAAPITPVGGTGAFVRDILANGPDDIWFVGLFNFLNVGGTTGLVMHWNGSSFTLHETPNFSIATEKNLSVARTGEGTLFVAGMHGRGGWGNTPYVLRGGGDNWEIIGQWPANEYTDLLSVVAFADDDAWIGAAKMAGTQFVGYVWMHWDGSGWTEFAVPETYHEPHLAAAGPEDVFSAGSDSLYRWDGAAWALAGRFDGYDYPNMNMLAIAADGAVFGAGRYFPGGASGRTLAARHEPAPLLRGDLNCDSAVNNFDIDPFVLALTDPAGFAATFPACDIRRADINVDGLVNNFDIDAFVALLTGG